MDGGFAAQKQKGTLFPIGTIKFRMKTNDTVRFSFFWLKKKWKSKKKRQEQEGRRRRKIKLNKEDFERDGLEVTTHSILLFIFILS